VATGDVTGDGVDEIVAATGPGPVNAVAVFKLDGTQLFSFTPYPGFTGGVWVAAGHLYPSPNVEIVTGAGEGGGPHVRVFTPTGQPDLAFPGFMAYDPRFRGGVRVAVAQVFAGPETGRIITGPGPGGGPDVRIVNADGAVGYAPFTAYDSRFTGGVFVAGGQA
jgi:hypothetical protein